MRTSRLAIWAVLAALATCGSAAAQNGPISGVTWSSTGRPAGNVNIAVCSTVATTAAAVSSNVATLSFASNPITQGFLVGQTMLVSGFTGGDTYFNGTFLIAATSSSTISYLLVHTNASAGSNGSVQQVGTLTQSCAPLAALTTDNTGSFSAPNPTTSDGNGNYNLWVAPGYYKVQTYASNYGLFFYFTGVACVPGASSGCVGTFGGSASASHLTYASGADILADVPGSAVTPATGAIALTPGADTTTPVTINSHSSTQSATQLDISNQSTGGGGTGTLAAPFLVEGKGFGAFNPTNQTTVAAIQQESQATAAFGLILTNKQAVGSGNRTSTLQLFCPDNGICGISGGNAVGDGTGSYSTLKFDGDPVLYGAASHPGQLGMVAIGSLASTLQSAFTIWNPVGSGGGAAQDTFDICRGTTLGYCLAGFDAGGAAGTVQNVNGFFKGVTSGSMLYGANPIAGTPCRFLFPTATPTSAGQVLQTAASASIESIASCQQSYYSIASSCGTIVFNGACAPSTTANSHCIGGAATLSGGASTITGLSPAFTSSSTYFVTTSDKTTPANSSSGVPASGTSITFAGTGTDVIQFIACGS